MRTIRWVRMVADNPLQKLNGIAIPGFCVYTISEPWLTQDRRWEIRISYIWAAALCTVFPTLWMFVQIFGTHKRVGGCCPRCGYDLRATPCAVQSAGRRVLHSKRRSEVNVTHRDAPEIGSPTMTRHVFSQHATRR